MAKINLFFAKAYVIKCTGNVISIILDLISLKRRKKRWPFSKPSSMHEKDRVKKLKGFPKNKSLMTLFSKHRFSIGLFDRNKDARGF